jgi:opacity protein-like surface antigen
VTAKNFHFKTRLKPSQKQLPLRVINRLSTHTCKAAAYALALKNGGCHSFPVYRVKVKVFNVSGNVMSVSKFVRTCAAAVSAMLLAHPVQAADIYGGGYKDGPIYVPVPLWQGFYAGGHLGGEWSTINPAENTLLLGSSGSIPVSSFSNSGVFGGVQFGYNVQAGNLLYGIEADFGGMDNSASAHFVDPTTPTRILYASSGGGFYGDITGRGGIILGNALIYAKGGFAFFTGDVSVSDPHDYLYQNSGTFTGWTVGAGLEYALSPNWTLKAEYMYFDFDNSNFSCCVGVGRLDNSFTVNTVKVGFNYIFHSLHSPLY